MLVINIVSSKREGSEASKHIISASTSWITSLLWTVLCCHSGGLLLRMAPLRYTARNLRSWVISRTACHSAGQEISSNFMQPRDSLPPSQKPQSIASHPISLRSIFVLTQNFTGLPIYSYFLHFLRACYTSRQLHPLQFCHPKTVAYLLKNIYDEAPHYAILSSPLY